MRTLLRAKNGWQIERNLPKAFIAIWCLTRTAAAATRSLQCTRRAAVLRGDVALLHTATLATVRGWSELLLVQRLGRLWISSLLGRETEKTRPLAWGAAGSCGAGWHGPVLGLVNEAASDVVGLR